MKTFLWCFIENNWFQINIRESIMINIEEWNTLYIQIDWNIEGRENIINLINFNKRSCGNMSNNNKNKTEIKTGNTERFEHYLKKSRNRFYNHWAISAISTWSTLKHDYLGVSFWS